MSLLVVVLAALPLPWPLGKLSGWGGDRVATVTISNAAWEATVGATAADIGIDVLGGSLATPSGGDGADTWVIEALPSGEMGLRNTANFTTPTAPTGVDLLIASTATIDGHLSATGKAVRIRHRIMLGKRDATGYDDAETHINFGITAQNRMTVQFGFQNLDSTGHWAVVDPGFGVAGTPNQCVEWGTVHLLDIYMARTASGYESLWLFDGQYLAHETSSALGDTRNQWRLRWQPGQSHDLWWLGGTVTDYASGGIAGNLGSPMEEVSDGGRYTLPDWDDESVVVLHGAHGQIPEGSEITLNSTTTPGAERFDTVWKWREAMDAVPTGIDKGQLSMSSFLPAYDAAIAVTPAYRLIGHSGLEILFFDDDDNPEWGFLIPDGTDATVTLQLRRWTGSAWASVDTGISIGRADPVTILNFSLRPGEPIGAAAWNCDDIGEGAEYAQWYRDDGTVFTGLMAARGYARANFSDPAPLSLSVDSIEFTRPRPETGQVVRFVLGAFSAAGMEFYMPMIGCQPVHGVDSYTQGTVQPPDDSIATPSSVTVSFQSRRFNAIRGRVADQGVTPMSRAVGPFHIEGRGGADLKNFIDDTLGGATNAAEYFAATAAMPRHVISHAINYIDRPGGDVDPAANLAALKATTLEFVGLMRAAGVDYALPIAPAPETGVSSSDWTEAQRDAVRAFNAWMIQQDAAGAFAGGYIADMITVLGGEEAATVAVGLDEDDVHPTDDRVYLDAWDSGVGPGASWQRSRDRYSDTRGAMSRGAQ